MNILGIGTIFSQGCGMDALESALGRGPLKPADVDALYGADGKRKAFTVDFDSVSDKGMLKKIRRADKLSKMSVVAAAAAVSDSGIPDLSDKKVGIILSTAFGAHVTTFEFLDGIIDYGEKNVSPTSFSNSVHNAAASYISTSLDIKGPTLTVTRFRFSFQSALELGKSWLEQGRCDYLLLGAVDQYGDVLGYVSDKKLNPSLEGEIKPFSFGQGGHIPGECSVFFLLGKESTSSSYCSIDGVYTCDDPHASQSVDLNVLSADGMLKDESLYLQHLSPEIPVAAYSPLFGSIMTGGAMNIAAAALMIKKQQVYASPGKSAFQELKIVEVSEPSDISTICCIDVNCRGECATVYLGRL
ncbi:MAG TPA: beta-ketoacyl synthase N-terminal-like domain-containing protein [Geobacteraceae bacterium]|nr:beta-ketoacyl synthase N-terminal-like domain-containing protein [Geobacteraceae bacterium]